MQRRALQVYAMQDMITELRANWFAPVGYRLVENGQVLRVGYQLTQAPKPTVYDLPARDGA